METNHKGMTVIAWMRVYRKHRRRMREQHVSTWSGQRALGKEGLGLVRQTDGSPEGECTRKTRAGLQESCGLKQAIARS